MSATHWYDRWSSLYDAVSAQDRFYRSARAEAIDRLQLEAGDTVLDLFCGTGVNTPLLADRVGNRGRIIGVDGSAGMLDRARARSLHEGVPTPVELVQADFGTDEGIRTVTKAAEDARPQAFLFTLGLTCLPNWREFSAAVLEAAPPGARFAILDVHSERLTLGARLINWIGAADCRRPVWKELELRGSEFSLVYHRPFALLDVSVIVASATKPDVVLSSPS